MAGAPIPPMPESLKLVYGHVVEGLFQKALAGMLTESCKVRLKGAGLDLDQKLKGAYQPAEWRAFLHIAVEELFPWLRREKAEYRLGELLGEGYATTGLGKAAIGIGRLLGTRRVLARATEQLQTITNYTTATLIERGPTECDLWVSDHHGLPRCMAGFLCRMLTLAGGEGVEVSPQVIRPDSATYRVTWREKRR
jgi:uncharacterized protein (TIGR02265 family)